MYQNNYFSQITIRFFWKKKKKKNVNQTKEKLDKYYGDSAPSIAMVKKWFTDFRCGRTSTNDAENVEKIHDMVLADRRVKVRES